MKKKLLSVLLITALGASLLAGCSSEKDSVSDKTEKKVEEKLTKVTLNEVAHSIFYAPMYVAIEEDYFKDEGIDLELVTGFGVHKLGEDLPSQTAYFRYFEDFFLKDDTIFSPSEVYAPEGFFKNFSSLNQKFIDKIFLTFSCDFRCSCNSVTPVPVYVH